MDVGLIGVGVVGSALKFGFETKRGHRVITYDIKDPSTSLSDVVNGTDIIFICVSTPKMSDGSCDVSNIESVVDKINEIASTRKDIVIKSTINPGTMKILIDKYPKHNFAMNPEFLLERAAIHDFCNQDICVIGTRINTLYDKVVKIHGNLAKEYIQTTPENAELIKYFCNVFNSTRIIFANLFYDISKRVGADYDECKRIATKRYNMIDSYLDCNENMRGFGGACLPKDTEAIRAFSKKIGINYSFLDGLLEDNERLKHE